MKFFDNLFKKKPKVKRLADIEQDYWRESDLDTFIYNVKQRIKRRTLGKERIRVDIYLRERIYHHGGETRREMVYDRRDAWTTLSPRDLQELGYKRIEGLYDSLLWWGVPVYMQIHGGEKFDVEHAMIKLPDGSEELAYSQDTPATLNDFMRSNATTDFIKGMSKTQLPAMDLQKLVMIGIIAAGAIFGLMMLGVI